MLETALLPWTINGNMILKICFLFSIAPAADQANSGGGCGRRAGPGGGSIGHARRASLPSGHVSKDLSLGGQIVLPDALGLALSTS